MSQRPAPGASAPPELIYIIRHGEKPAYPPAADPGQDPPPPAPPFGVDYQGNQDEHSLLPRGWQRSGALAVLFDPALGALQAGLQVPQLCCRRPTATRARQPRTGPTRRSRVSATASGLKTASDFAEGQEPQLAASVVSTCSGVVLICWEHQHIPALASSLPACPGNRHTPAVAR